jgi:hypothetical protein
VEEGRGTPLVLPQTCVRSNQATFGAADGRPVQPETQVRREPKPSRMGDALAVTENHVGIRLYLSHRFKE